MLVNKIIKNTITHRAASVVGLLKYTVTCYVRESSDSTGFNVARISRKKAMLRESDTRTKQRFHKGFFAMPLENNFGSQKNLSVNSP